MDLSKLKIPQDEEGRLSFLPEYAVELEHLKARALGVPRYYALDGYLVEELDGKIKKNKTNQ